MSEELIIKSSTLFRAVYFYTYSTSKRMWNESGVFVPNSAIVHMISAGSAGERQVYLHAYYCSSGLLAATAVNPIWLVKTRLQLDPANVTIWQMVKRVYKREGMRGFYRVSDTGCCNELLSQGVTASYAGVSETMIQFVIYEHLRGIVLEASKGTDKSNMVSNRRQWGNL